MGVKLTPEDILFSRLIRTRDDWTCRHCGIDCSHDRIQLHCAHIVGRRVLRLRHEPDNAMALCASCHADFTTRPTEFSVFVRGQLSEGVVDRLHELSRLIHKRPKGWQTEIRAHLREQIRLLESAQASGGQHSLVPYW